MCIIKSNCLKYMIYYYYNSLTVLRLNKISPLNIVYSKIRYETMIFLKTVKIKPSNDTKKV
jgi:hypothetical protein